MMRSLNVGTDFYVTGGTLPRDAPCYVPRKADQDLLEGLQGGQFCYVLTSRQMGKSSLMVRTATTLRQQGHTCIVLDLTAIGQNLDTERWYAGLLNQLGQQVGLEDDLDDYWLAPSTLGPMQRWMQAVQQVVLTSVPGPVVIFVDEIDAVRSLPFSADEFFAGIRECYNRRSEAPELARLTFCLLGVATPSDLIRDTRTTPFNIGKRIELTDFTSEEARSLTAGLGDGTEAQCLLSRVLYWTGGHPYLTQRLCQAISAQLPAAHQSPATCHRPPYVLVDRLCEALFLSSGARERDDNLLFVRELLLRSEVDLAALLDLYARVHQGKRVSGEETNELVSLLRLSGIVKASERLLGVRNRIYARVFDRVWVRDHMPYAELWRQQMAYRRGVLRTASVSAVILTQIIILAIWAIRSAREARQNLALAHKETRHVQALAGTLSQSEQELRQALYRSQTAETLANRRRHETEQMTGRLSMALGKRDKALQVASAAERQARNAANRADRNAANARRQAARSDYLLYVSTMNLLGREWARGNLPVIPILLDRTEHNPNRNFEWEFWHHLYHTRVIDRITLDYTWTPFGAVSPDGRTVAVCSASEILLWRPAGHSPVVHLKGHHNVVLSLAYSPNGHRLLSASADGTLRLWDTVSKQTIRIFSQAGHHPRVAFSPDGKQALSGDFEGHIYLWNVNTGIRERSFRFFTSPVFSLTFSPDNRYLAASGADRRIFVWERAGNGNARAFVGHNYSVPTVTFSPDSKRLFSGSDDRTARVWDVASGSTLFVLKGHGDTVASVAYTQDGSTLLTGGFDGNLKEWDAADGRLIQTIPHLSMRIWAVAPFPQKKQEQKQVLVISGYEAHVLSIGSASDQADIALKSSYAPTACCYSHDGTRLITGSNASNICVRDTRTRRPLITIRGHVVIRSAAFSPDDTMILTTEWQDAVPRDSTTRLWDSRTGRQLLAFHRPSITTFDTADNISVAAAFSADGRRVAIGGDDGILLLRNAKTGRLLRSLRLFRAIRVVAFARNDQQIAVANADWITLIEARTCAVQREIHGFGTITSLALSPDGSRLVAGSYDRRIAVYDTHTGDKVLELAGHTDRVFTVAYSPDGKRILTGSQDGSVRLWDAATGIELLNWFEASGSIVWAAFAPGGAEIAITACTSGSSITNGVDGMVDGVTKIWNVTQHTAPIYAIARKAAADNDATDNGRRRPTSRRGLPGRGEIYVGPMLAAGLNMGAATSAGLPNWVTDHKGYWECNYPSGQQWGTVFITFGQPVASINSRPCYDYSTYNYLLLDIKGAHGGEAVQVGVKTESDPDNGAEPQFQISNLKTDWQTVVIPLSSLISDPIYPASRLEHLYVLFELIFGSDMPETISFRNIRYAQ